ncbi:peptide chain release factor N(5)-glutamine methyltransferase [endosymbiont 'TC1' of Trimyema compressum]|uniref:peptide chain release factor N(5)-glutamine methyltransferase n=1 Tax=endosymbiont 'TC1' of Trimyema compressum TaxID=243899 RepID=UPI000B4C9473|nr:peptide chain release factor N(5)-glutamine methyltransferase [endosymbiont 'TC1' of Trimyema compressum]
MGYCGTEVEAILADVLNKERVYLHMHGEKNVDSLIESTFLKKIDMLEAGYPFHYVMGKKEWMGLDFLVNEATLIPREDTRILLEAILSLKDKASNPVLVEIGTGSGILPVLVKKNWEDSVIYTVEVNETTLAVAKANFKNHHVEIRALKGDFLEPLKERNITCKVLFSNPPYISKEEMEVLDASVKKEPYGAFFGGEDGLDYYRRLSNEYSLVLEKSGYLIVEIGWLQGLAVKEIFESKGLIHVATFKDDGNRDRVIMMQRKLK